MYKSEMQRSIEQALGSVLSKAADVALKLSPEDRVELANLLTEDIWSAGYELEPRMRLGQTINASRASEL